MQRVRYPRRIRERAFSQRIEGAEEPLVLVRQREYIDEPSPGAYKHIRKVRIAEWPVEFLSRPRRNRNTIPRFLSPDAPPNRLDIIRGVAGRKPRRKRRAAARRVHSSRQRFLAMRRTNVGR